MDTTPPSDRLRIIVLGYIIRGPLGGLAWHHLQYVLGLGQLGHDVYFFEDSGDYPACYDPSRHTTDTDPSFGLNFITHIFEKFGLGSRWAYYDSHTQRWRGPSAEQSIVLSESADLLLNVSGVNPIRPWLLNIPHRVLIDTDPAFTQINYLTDPKARRTAAQHTAFFSFGENIGSTGCIIPPDGFPWRPTRQPIVLNVWPVTPGVPDGRFTTVMQWDSYSQRKHDGHSYGMKSKSFQPFIDLPQRTQSRLELALGNQSAPRDLLTDNGWSLRDPLEVTCDPWAYQRYIQTSKAEFSIAKHGYVTSRSGWFSERSAAYLASGRPVVVQETGFSDWLHADAGVAPFHDPDSALTGIENINHRYEYHCNAARDIAREYFDAQRVLSRLITNTLEHRGVTKQTAHDSSAK